MRCEACGNTLTIHNGEYVCSHCGLVHERVIAYFSPYQHPSTFNTKYSYMRSLKGWDIHKTFRKLKSIERSTMTKYNWKLYYHCGYLYRVCDQLDIPMVVFKRTCYLLLQLMKRVKRIEKDHVFLLLMVAIREFQLPIAWNRVRKTFEDVTGKPLRLLWKALKVIKVPKASFQVFAYHLIQEYASPSDVLPLYRRVLYVYERLKEYPIVGQRNPARVAACLCYYALRVNGYQVNQSLFASELGISSFCIRDTRLAIDKLLSRQGHTLKSYLKEVIK